MKCGEVAIFRCTWSGRDEVYVCLSHALRLDQVAEAMGLHLQLIPLSAEDQELIRCSQEVNKVAAASEEHT